MSNLNRTSNLIEGVKNTIKKHNMLCCGDTVIVGVSGGADSLCLLHALKALEDFYQMKLYAVHLNHQFRGAEADADAEFVAQTCKAWGIPAFIESFDVPAYIRKTGLSPEEAGRKIRYQIFDTIYKKVGGSKIAVAQNQNDNAETVMMRFLRGTGIEGLRGIDGVRGHIIRPLIETERAAIEAYCQENNLEPRVDHTNFETIYSRNKVRLELLPYIREQFNANIMNTLIRFSGLMREENDYLEAQALKAFEGAVDREKASEGLGETVSRDNQIQYYKEALRQMHPALRRRVIRLGLEKLAGSLQGFEFKHIDSIAELLTKSTGAAVVLPQKLRAYISYDKLILSKNIEKHDKKCYYKLKYDYYNTVDDNNIIIAVHRKKIDEIHSIIKSKTIIAIDESKIQGELVYRTREEGDRFSPLGMGGSKKLKDYFIDEKIPKEERDKIELIADGKEIVWVIGRRLSDKYKITENTKDIIIIKYERGTTDA